MKIVSVVFVLFLAPVVLLGYELQLTEVAQPYDPVPVETEALSVQQVFLGELQDFPIMYELSIDTADVLTVQMKQRYGGAREPIDFSLILIKENDNGKGVTEIGRLRPRNEHWVVSKDKEVGMTFWESVALSKEVEPGVYRLEISTPDNHGKYLLAFGEEDANSGYFERIGYAHKIQQFFGFGFLKILSSSLVYSLVGIALLLLASYKIWRYRSGIYHDR